MVNNAKSDAAELSSVMSALEDLQRRAVEVADRWRGLERDDISGELYDVERSLRSALRRTNKAMLILEDLG